MPAAWSAHPSPRRQAVQLLVNYPGSADKVRDLSALASLQRPGISLIVHLVEELHDQPCDKTAVLLERWRGRPDVEHLEKLAVMPLIAINDEAGAAQELLGALERLLKEEESQRRYDELVRRHKQDGQAGGPEADIDPPGAGRSLPPAGRT